MNIREVRNITKKIEGWLKDNEGELLFTLAKRCRGKGVIVEIGSWKGKSTIWLAYGSKSGKKIKIYAVDPHTGSSEHQKEKKKIWTFDEFKKNIKEAGVEDLIIPIVKTSEEAAKRFNRPVELIFIDGEHKYESVKMDFKLWFPKVVNGGIMAFHDTIVGYGPKRVVIDYLYKSKHFKNVRFVGSITYGQKVRNNSLKDKIKNRYMLLLRNLYEFGTKLPRPIKSFIKIFLNFIF